MACVRSMEIKASVCRYDILTACTAHNFVCFIITDGSAFCCSNCYECISWPHYVSQGSLPLVLTSMPVLQSAPLAYRRPRMAIGPTPCRYVYRIAG